MKKILTILIMAAGITAGLAQQPITGIIRDITTNQAMPLVSVTSDNEKHTTVSNSDGTFRIYCGPETTKLKFSYLGYQPLTLTLTRLPEDGIYYLEPKSFELEEVVVMNTPINEILENLIKSSKAKLSSPVILNTYCREFVKFNGRYAKFADGLVDYKIYKKGETNIKSEAVVKQVRRKSMFNYQEDEGFFIFVADDIRKTAEHDCDFELLRKVLLKGKQYKDYEFTCRTKTSNEGEGLTTISFTPKKDDGTDKFEGTITYDPINNIILNIEAKKFKSEIHPPESHSLIFAQFQYLDASYKSMLKLENGIYRLYYSSLYEEARVWKTNGYDNTYALKNDMVVTDMTTDETEFAGYDKYNSRTLYDGLVFYKTSFWNTNNTLPLTPEEEEIIKSLQNSE